jgi:conjugal transfer pilus assembly protein TraL
MDKYYLPQLLDAPFRVFLLTIDELILLIMPIILFGFVLNQMIVGFMLGIYLLVMVKKFKGEQGHYYLANLAYWYLPPIIKFKVTPPSYIRHYLG